MNRELNKYMGLDWKLDLHRQSTKASLTPMIINEKNLEGTPIDVFSRLMSERIIFLGTEVTDEVSNIIQAQLLYLDSTDSTKPIRIYINSPGGSIYDGLAIIDTMNYVKSPVHTIVTGLAASMAAVIAAAGQKGHRAALKNSTIMLHQPMGGIGYGTKADEIRIISDHIDDLKGRLYNILAEDTGHSAEKIIKDTLNDTWFTATTAKEYGLIDKVISR
jgi:ATP-dependent Clp protease protease subunit